MKIPDRIKVLAELCAIGAVVAMVSWAMIESRGNTKWAQKESTETALKNQQESINQLSRIADRMEAHIFDNNVHMPKSEKDDIYVPRRELDLRLTNIEEDVDEIKQTTITMSKETKDTNRRNEEMFRAILERLPE